MSLLPHYTHIVNPKLKHIYLSFNNEGDLIIKSPKVPQEHIEKLLLKKASWIIKSREKINTKKGRLPNFLDDPILYYLGKAYKLILIQHDKKRTTLHFDGDIFTLFYHKYDENIFKKHIDTFYKKEAISYIPQYIGLWSKTMQLTPNKTSFRKTKRQWGSCSENNNLSFNTMIMKLPKDVIQYIIIHELAHIKHKHHKETFWSLVEHTMPTYTIQAEELRHYTT